VAKHGLILIKSTYYKNCPKYCRIVVDKNNAVLFMNLATTICFFNSPSSESF
jgi:hypothetical protein